MCTVVYSPHVVLTMFDRIIYYTYFSLIPLTTCDFYYQYFVPMIPSHVGWAIDNFMSSLRLLGAVPWDRSRFALSLLFAVMVLQWRTPQLTNTGVFKEALVDGRCCRSFSMIQLTGESQKGLVEVAQSLQLMLVTCCIYEAPHMEVYLLLQFYV